MADAGAARPIVLPANTRPEDVSTLVDRIAASPTFARSDQLVRFLRFVVSETLAGRAHLLKEYTIGVEALGRSPKFDPTVDSVVRVQARQLRFKLAEYFASEGHLERIRIDLPKGSYAPTFFAQSAASSQSVSTEGDVAARIVATPVTTASPAQATPSVRTRPHILPTRPFALVGGLALVALTIFAAASIPRSPSHADRAGVAGAQHALVVLPFLNLTGDAGDEYISDGVTDEVTAALAALPGERVVARTSAFQFKTHSADVRTIGRELGVDNVIEGSVRRTGDTIRITVQMSRASDGLHLWAASFDAPSSNVLRADETVARAVVEALGRHSRVSTAGMAPPRAPTTDPQAYASYLKARYYLNRRDLASMNRAIALFDEAVRRDSSFALALSGLAATHATMAINSQTAPGIGPPKAEATARRALAIDSTIGEAHATLGLMRAFAHWDWTGADSEFSRAIELSPNLASAHSWYAVTLIARGSFDAALDQLRYAQRLDPLSMPIAYSIGETMFYARRWNEAMLQARTVLELDSTYLGGYNLLWRIDAETGRYADALGAMRKEGDTIAAPIILARMGRVREAREAIARFPSDRQRQVPYFVACLYAATGDRDSAFAWLDRAYASGQIDIVSMGVDPEMDPLRNDARFNGLLRKIGLAPRREP